MFALKLLLVFLVPGFQVLLIPPLLAGGFTLPRTCQNVTVFEHDVYEKYFSKTERWERPVKNLPDVVDVSLRLVLFGINEIAERKGTVELSGYLNIAWYDGIHIWNDTMPYACLNSIHLYIDKAWIPEVALLNAQHKYELVQSEGVEKVRHFSNGSVSYRPGGTFTTYCKFDLTYLPFDRQVCTLEFEPWRYATDSQYMNFGDPPISKKYWRENEQWSLAGARHYKSQQNYITDNLYDHLTYELIFQRKTGYYWMNVILPSIIISLAQLSVFTLPIDEVIKVHVSFTCLLAYGVFQLMIIEDMPRSSDHIPLLSIYIDLSMGYIFLAILGLGLTFVCLRLAERHHLQKHVPVSLFFVAHMVGAFMSVPFPLAIDKAKQAEELEKAVKAKDVHMSKTGQIYTTVFSNVTLPARPEQPVWTKINNDENPERRPLVINSRGEHIPPSVLLTEGMGNVILPSKDLHHVKTRHQWEWEYLAAIVDRLTSVVYVIVAIGTPIVMFGIVPATFSKRQTVDFVSLNL